MSLIVLPRSSCTSRRIVCTFLGVELMEFRSDLSSSSSDVLPLLKPACHSKHLTRLMASFIYARCIISKVSAQICRVSRSIWCLLSAPVSRPCWNRKCEDTRGDKHSRCKTPNIHTATPLGILSGDVPCSQAQRTDSRTAIGWRSMELVSKLFDPPLYSGGASCSHLLENRIDKFMSTAILETFGGRRPASKSSICPCRRNWKQEDFIGRAYRRSSTFSEETIQNVRDLLLASPKRSLSRLSQESVLSRSTR